MFDLGDIRTLPPGASFPDLYQYYMHHAENVHRFIRAPVLHSFVFLWLMSKYKIHPADRGSFGEPAQEAFRRGVQGAADRTFGESDSDRARRKNLAVASGEKIIETFEPGKLKDGTILTEKDVELKRGMARQMNEEVTNIFDADTTFHRRKLQELLETWFSDAAASTSGTLKRVLDDSREFISIYRSIYTRLLGILNLPENLKEAEAIERKITKLGPDDYKEALLSVAKRAREILSEDRKDKPTDLAANDEATFAYRRKVRHEVLDMLSKEVGRTSIQRFAGMFDKEAGKIKEQIRELKQLYRTDRKINDALQKVESVAAGAGMPSAVASDQDLGAISTELVVKKIAQGNPPSEGVFPNSDSVQREFDKESPPEMITGKLKVGKSRVGDVEMRRDGTKVMLDVSEFRKATLDQDVTLALDDSGSITTFDEVDSEGDIRSFLLDTMHDQPLSDEEIGEQVKDLPSEYGNLRERLRELYCGKGATELGRDALDNFQRAMRALCMGEFLQAAPDAESRLDVADHCCPNKVRTINHNLLFLN